jgi:5-methyltetrahydropteroyltriglutamate--homocysteine methyltransferase
MTVPTEPIGSIPRPTALIDALSATPRKTPRWSLCTKRPSKTRSRGSRRTGSPVITDGEQRKYHNFWTYCVHGLPNTAPDGFRIPFAGGHTRRMPRLSHGPFHETEVRSCLDKRAHAVQVDFTEGRFAMKLDPSGELLTSFIELNNLALSRFSEKDRARIGVHTCPGGDRDSTHSADIDYAELLPSLFELKAGNFYIALAGEPDRERVLLERERPHVLVSDVGMPNVDGYELLRRVRALGRTGHAIRD